MPVRSYLFPAFSLTMLAGCPQESKLSVYNAEPKAEITSPADGAAVLSGTVLSLRGAASDDNDAASDLSARWFVNDAEACAAATPAADGTTLCEATVPEGDTVAIRLEVVDPKGEAGTDTVTLSVITNAAPVATIESPLTDGVYYSDQLITFRGAVVDAEDGPATLTAFWEDGATRLDLVDSTVTASGEVLGYSTLSEGAHALELHVVDSAGGEDIATVLIDVGAPNSTPDCAITAPADGTADGEGVTVIFRGSVSDADIPSDQLQATWTSDKDGVLGTSLPTSGGSITFPYDALSTNTHVVTLQVADEVGATCTADILYTVGSPPTIDLDAPAIDEVVNEGDNLTFTATVADNEDSAANLWLTWESDVDGVFYEGPPNSSGVAQFFDSGLSLGPHSLTVTVLDTDGLYGNALGSFIVNGVPSAPVVSITPADPDTDDDLRVNLDVPSVDPDGDPLTTTYTWSLDGVVSGASTTSTLDAASTTRGDTWSVEVVASDGYGDSPAGTASVTIANTAPTLSSVTLSPDPATEDDVLACTAGTTSDADGDTVSVAYEWVVNGTALGFDSDSLDGSSFSRDDSVVCTATPFDSTEDGTTRTSSTLTIENSAPSIATVSITPSTAKASSTLTCDYSGYSDSDGDADQSTYAWTVDGLTVGTSATLSGAFVGGDIVTCTVTPEDGTDSGTAVAGSVTIGNTAPVLASVSLTPTAATESSTLSCVPGTATDADGTTSFTYSYAWTVNGAAMAATTSTLTGTYFAAADAVACVVTANDGTSSSAAVTSNSVTIANTAPVMATVAVSPSTGRVGDTLTCAASATDVDGGSPSLAYAWSTGATGASLTLTSAHDPGDVLTCTATATDSAGASDSDTASATVTNTSPVVASVSVSPSTGKVGDVLTCAATATDADGGSPTLSYAWSTGATGSSVTLSASNDPGDVLTCTATATDTDGGTGTDSASATVSNTAPVLGTVSISPTTAYNDDVLTCSASATDADGGTPTLSYAWTNTSSATSIGSGATLSLSSSLAASRQTIACTVTATDADSGTASGSASLTLSNRAPVATASLTPASPTRTSTLTCTGSATDADADSTSLTFAWTVGGSPVSASSTTALSSTLAGAFMAGQLVACTVTASDGKTGSDTDSASVTIGNNAPSVTSVTLSPSTVYTSDTLTATVVSSDADGDTLTTSYAWTVGGSLVSATSATLSGTSYFSKNQAVYVTATVNDGTTSTSLASSSVTVSNTAPTAPVVEVTPADAVEGDDLTCSVTTASTDADGDALTYSFAWDVDGVDYTSATDAATSSVVDGADVGGEEVWTCEVEAGDGTGTSGVGVDSVTVAATCVDGNTVTATIAVGTNPYGVAVSPDGTTAYITNIWSNSVSVIDTATNTVTATIAVGSNPRAVAVSPDGATAYIANAGRDSVSMIDTATNTVTGTIAVGSNPFAVAVSPDGTTAYTANYASNSVSVIDTATNTVTATIAIRVRPGGVAVSPDGTTAYTANVNDDSVYVFDTATNTVTATIAVGTTPYAVAVSPDGTTAYIANANSSSVSVIDTATNTVTATIAVGTNPYGVAVSPDGTTVYITNGGSNSVSVIHICGG